jgi:hypothetical protein
MLHPSRAEQLCSRNLRINLNVTFDSNVLSALARDVVIHLYVLVASVSVRHARKQVNATGEKICWERPPQMKLEGVKVISFCSLSGELEGLPTVPKDPPQVSNNTSRLCTSSIQTRIDPPVQSFSKVAR